MKLRTDYRDRAASIFWLCADDWFYLVNSFQGRRFKRVQVVIVAVILMVIFTTNGFIVVDSARSVGIHKIQFVAIPKIMSPSEIGVSKVTEYSYHFGSPCKETFSLWSGCRNQNSFYVVDRNKDGNGFVLGIGRLARKLLTRRDSPCQQLINLITYVKNIPLTQKNCFAAQFQVGRHRFPIVLYGKGYFKIAPEEVRLVWNPWNEGKVSPPSFDTCFRLFDCGGSGNVGIGSTSFNLEQSGLSGLSTQTSHIGRLNSAHSGIFRSVGTLVGDIGLNAVYSRSNDRAYKESTGKKYHATVERQLALFIGSLGILLSTFFCFRFIRRSGEEGDATFIMNFWFFGFWMLLGHLSAFCVGLEIMDRW
jgi:hypothetical protein